MPPATNPWLKSMASTAVATAGATGFYPSVILAQWADETAFGESVAWVQGYNPAGISPGGVIASYPSLTAGMNAYVSTAKLAYYDPVRAAYPAGPITQAYALGAGPWAAGHYCAPGQRPGTSLVDLINTYGLTAIDPAPPVTNPLPQQEPQMNQMFAYDPTSGGVWETDANGALYCELGAPFVANLVQHPEYKAGSAESGGASQCVGIAPWKDQHGDIGVVFFTSDGHAAPDGSPYHVYAFNRDGTVG